MAVGYSYENIVDKLPNAPSELILTALADLEWCEKQPDLHINMRHWITPISMGGVCQVCLAGASLVRTCGVRPAACDPFDLACLEVTNPKQSNLRHKMLALNSFRHGSVMSGLLFLIDEEWIPRAAKKEFTDCVKICPYHLSPELFKKQLLQLAERLRAHGL